MLIVLFFCSLEAKGWVDLDIMHYVNGFPLLFSQVISLDSRRMGRHRVYYLRGLDDKFGKKNYLPSIMMKFGYYM